ncbi:MAG: hypothetical protein Ct9H300mP18_06060 [Candidatus Neomarinimicrobiota bacterium]|nr:MAG: hypothetical protein Ct9H300mP18_06060 [Candidatus Neomarinimicrobiota bacterium]
MNKKIKLPDLGEGIEGAEVSEVKVSIGDKLKPEDTILVLESDKASMEIPAEVIGVVTKVAVKVGDLVNLVSYLSVDIEIKLNKQMKKQKPSLLIKKISREKGLKQTPQN